MRTGIGVVALLGLIACGQRGALYLPTEAAAAQRATLPQTFWPNQAVVNPPPQASASAPNR